MWSLIKGIFKLIGLLFTGLGHAVTEVNTQLESYNKSKYSDKPVEVVLSELSKKSIGWVYIPSSEYDRLFTLGFEMFFEELEQEYYFNCQKDCFGVRHSSNDWFQLTYYGVADAKSACDVGREYNQILKSIRGNSR